MDAKGHHECAAEAGEPLLRAALAGTGKPNQRLAAFYMGNWCTDVSQAVDPVAYSAVQAKGKKYLVEPLNALIKDIEAIPTSRWTDFMRDYCVKALRTMRDHLQQALTILQDPPEDPARPGKLPKGRNGRVALLARKTFFVLGYFKFVHPEKGKRAARMDYKAYKHVFSERYTQYYPHEHLDRFPQETRGYGADIAPGTRTPAGCGTGSPNLSPHLYLYLADAAQMAAGLLAEIDREWARHNFGPSAAQKKWPDDTDPAWNLWLAKMGHALHQVEDFFTHTNFIEHALLRLGSDFMPPEKTGILIDSPRVVFTKRLLRYSNTHSDNDRTWTSLHAEPHVVSGYFDFQDTAVSLKHVYEDLFGGKKGSGQKSDRRMEQVQKLLRVTIEGVQERTKGKDTLTEAEARKVGEEVVRELASGSDPDVAEAANEVQNQAPAEIRDALYESIAGYSMRHGSTTLSLYDALLSVKGFVDFIEQPLKWLSSIAKFLPESVRTVVEKYVSGPLNRKVAQLIEQHLGRMRVGSHSLLSKDYARQIEELDKIYQRAKDCAKAVHWCIVKTMTRWAEPPTLFVCRADPCDQSVDPDQTNTVDARTWIDWLELVEFFLRHPATTCTPGGGQKWWEGVVRHGWTGLPGYNGVAAGRRKDLSHRLVFIDEALATRRVKDAAGVRERAIARYVP